jgi:Conjugal transfer protein TraD
MDARKFDTRRKIQLGGLIVKAGIAEEPAAVLLGLLLEAAQKLAGPGGDAARERWQAAGEAEFATSSDSKKQASSRDAGKVA